LFPWKEINSLLRLLCDNRRVDSQLADEVFKMARTGAGYYDERRKEFRLATRRHVKIALVASADWQDCTILDESPGGAQVELPGRLDSVDEVNVALDAGDIRLARIRWFRGTRAGLEFYQPPPVAVVAGVKPADREEDDCVGEIRLADIEAGARRMGFMAGPDAVRRTGTSDLLLEDGVLPAGAAAYLPGALGRRGGAEARVLTGAEACKLFEADFI